MAKKSHIHQRKKLNGVAPSTDTKVMYNKIMYNMFNTFGYPFQQDVTFVGTRHYILPL
jgi:hypothetical protein